MRTCKIVLFWAASCFLLTAFCPLPAYETVAVQADTVSLIRNPCMGWGLYDDANNEVQDADAYWKAQDRAARDYASFFYIRWRWSDMEPAEGRYAWKYDENYRKLIQGALDRGLKLCFRIYNNAQDNLRQATPDYVRRAGAEGYTVQGRHGPLWTPYPDDPVFLDKLAAFVRAFAQEYDDPARVDFVDAYNIGWWGECHHIRLLDSSRLEAVFDTITTIYASCFKRVIPVLPFNSQVGFAAEERIAVDGKGYALRRDGLGSMWFSEAEQQMARRMFGRTLLIGESCWWGGSDTARPFSADTYYKLDSWREVFELTCRQALDFGFNTLDLREPSETRRWTTLAGDLVTDFVRHGGYRICPDTVTLPARVTAGTQARIVHSWKNTGTGYLPNNVSNWNFKYKPAFALLDADGAVVKRFVDTEADPSAWIHGQTYRYTFPVDFRDVPSGTYRWGVAIVDRSQKDAPGIRLAAEAPECSGWTVLGPVTVLP